MARRYCAAWDKVGADMPRSGISALNRRSAFKDGCYFSKYKKFASIPQGAARRREAAARGPHGSAEREVDVSAII